jgi:hypothetical protein
MAPVKFLDGQTWNTVFSNKVYQAPVGGVDGQLEIPPNKGQKFLEGISARWTWNGAAPASNPSQWMVRVIVALGSFNPDTLGLAAQGAGNAVPNIQSFNGVGGLSQVILDTLIVPVTPFYMAFPTPLVIPAATPLTMLMSRPITDAFIEAASNVSQNYFALYGYDEGRKGINVNFR